MDLNKIINRIIDDLPIQSIIQTIIMYIYDMVVEFFLVLLISMYMLFDKHTKQNDLKNEIDRQITHYIGLKTIISIFVAFTIYIFFGPIMEMRFATFICAITFILNYIPNIVYLYYFIGTNNSNINTNTITIIM